jgi:hypothetical protein
MVIGHEPFYILTFNNGGPGGLLHWIVGGGQADVVERRLLTDVSNEVKGNPTLMRRVAIAGWSVLIYRFPEFPAGGPNGGHWAAVVRIGDEMVFASLHGERYVDATVEMAVSLASSSGLGPALDGLR